MKQHLRPALVSLVAFTVLLGVVYPLAMDAIAAVAFPREASGSLIRDAHGRVVGSELIGQPFDDPGYFWSRPAAAHYDALASAASNLGPSNPALAAAARERIAALRAADPSNTAPVPVDLVTTSASGLDPHISPAAAYYQAARVARARGISETAVRGLVAAHLQRRTFGVLGEPRVNVLLLNRALDDGER